MKKLFIVIVSMCLIMLPNYLNASTKGIEALNLEEVLKSEGIEPLFEKEYKEDDSQVTIYFFRGQGESKSVDFLNYLNSIYDEYGRFFKLKSYEVGSNAKNSKLMDNVLDYIHSDVTTVPFIVIGDTHFTTYNETVNENLLKTIIEYYESGNKIDKVSEVLVKYYRNYDLMIAIIIILVLTFIGFMIYASVKNNKE